MLANAKDIEADLISELDLLEQVAQPAPRPRFLIRVGKAVDAYLHEENLVARVMLLARTGGGQHVR